MNIQLIKKLFERFKNISEEKKQTPETRLTQWDVHQLYPYLALFVKFKDQQFCDLLLRHAIDEIYGSKGILDLYIADLEAKLCGEDTSKKSKEQYGRVRSFLNNLVTYPINMEKLGGTLKQARSTSPAPTERNAVALVFYMQEHKDKGKALAEILDKIEKEKNPAGLIGTKAKGSKAQYKLNKILKYVVKLKSVSCFNYLVQKEKMDELLPILEEIFWSSLKNADFIATNLPDFNTEVTDRQILSTRPYNRINFLSILVKHARRISVSSKTSESFIVAQTGTGQKFFAGLYAHWSMCALLEKNSYLTFRNKVRLFEYPDKAVQSLKLLQVKLLDTDELSRMSITNQIKTLGVALKEEKSAFGLDTIEMIRSELSQSKQSLEYLTPHHYGFQNDQILLEYAITHNDDNVLNDISEKYWAGLIQHAVDPENIDACLISWVNDHEPEMLRYSILIKLIAFSADRVIKYVIDQFQIGMEIDSEEDTIKNPFLVLSATVATEDRDDFISMICENAGKQTINLLLQMKFMTREELPKSVQSALELNDREYACKILTGQSRWRQYYGDAAPEEFMKLFNPCAFQQQSYEAFLKITKIAEALQRGVDDGLARQRAFKLAVLFQKPETMFSFVGTHCPQDSFHNFCLFDLPGRGKWVPVPWQEFLGKHGRSALRWIGFAGDIYALGIELPATEGELRIIVKEKIYGRRTYKDDSEKLFAELCMDRGITPDIFLRCLKFKRNGNIKSHDVMPDFSIDGKAIGAPEYTFRKLPADDLRGLVLGKLTNCCQYLGGPGESCAIYGMSEPESCFYVVEYKGKIVAQLWAWGGKGKLSQTQLSKEGGKEKAPKETFIVFDSWERLRPENDWLISRFLPYLLDEFGKTPAPADEKELIYTRLSIGNGGATPRHLCFKGLEVFRSIPQMDDTVYSDAKRQMLVPSLSEIYDLELKYYIGECASAIQYGHNSLSWFIEDRGHLFDRDAAVTMFHLFKSRPDVSAIQLLEATSNDEIAGFLIKLTLRDPNVIQNIKKLIPQRDDLTDFGDIKPGYFIKKK